MLDFILVKCDFFVYEFIFIVYKLNTDSNFNKIFNAKFVLTKI